MRLPFLASCVDVAGERQRHDVGVEPVDDGARLLAGAAVRLVDRDVLAGLLLPVLGEGRVVVLIELARRIVGDVEQRRLGGVGELGASDDGRLPRRARWPRGGKMQSSSGASSLFVTSPDERVRGTR